MTETAPAPRLLPTSWTSAGDVTPQSADERSPFPLRTRIEAVAADGWDGFGIVHDDLIEFLRSGSYTDLSSILADNGIERGHGIESCDEQCAHDDADEQRYVHFFGDERQDDGDDCRSESPG